MRYSLISATIAAGLALSGCQKEADTAARTDTPASTPAADALTPEPTGTPAAPAPAATIIQTQPGPKGAQIALNRLAVTGNVMTAQFTATGGSCCAYLDVEDVAAIDDSTTRRMAVLKDDTGKWMAAPLQSDGKRLRLFDSGGKPQIVWLKFPAPPPETQTVSITIPEVGPFDGVPVTR